MSNLIRGGQEEGHWSLRNAGWAAGFVPWLLVPKLHLGTREKPKNLVTTQMHKFPLRRLFSGCIATARLVE